LIWNQGGLQLVEATFICEGYPPSVQSLEVNIGPPPQPGDIIGDNPVCEYTTHTYTTTISPYDSCEWKVNGILLPTVLPELTYSFGAQGDYLFEVKAYNYCGVSDPEYLTVQAQKLPVVFLGSDTTILQGQVLILDAGNPGCSYQWSTGATSQTITVTASGQYSVIVTNTCGSGSDTINVEVIVNQDELIFDEISYLVQELVIQLNDPGNLITEWQLFSITGELIYRGEEEKSIVVPSEGIYLLRLNAKNAIFSYKIPVF
jgi:hypothetical protein